MKALSVRQPWAAAIVTGLKTIETRTYYTKYRGPLLIVSSKSCDKVMMDYVLSLVNDRERFLANMFYGHAVATVNLVDCRPMKYNDEDAAMCDMYDSAFAWILEDIKPIKPFPVKGQLGLFEVEAKIVEKATCRVCGCTDSRACRGNHL